MSLTNSICVHAKPTSTRVFDVQHHLHTVHSGTFAFVPCTNPLPNWWMWTKWAEPLPAICRIELWHAFWQQSDRSHLGSQLKPHEEHSRAQPSLCVLPPVLLNMSACWSTNKEIGWYHNKHTRMGAVMPLLLRPRPSPFFQPIFWSIRFPRFLSSNGWGLGVESTNFRLLYDMCMCACVRACICAKCCNVCTYICGVVFARMNTMELTAQVVM